MDELVVLPIGEMNELLDSPENALSPYWHVTPINEVDDGQPLGWDEEQ